MSDPEAKIDHIADTIARGLVAIGTTDATLELLSRWFTNAAYRAVWVEELLRSRLDETPHADTEELLEQLVDAYPLPGERDEVV